MRKGFTLVELLGVVVIMGVIALIAVPTIDSIVKKNKEKAYDSTKNTIIAASKNWLIDNKSLLDDGETVSVTLADLKEQGYLDFDIKNPSSGKCLNNAMEISISRNEKKYTYVIIGNELVDSSATECETTGRAPSIYLLGSNPLNVEINTPFVDPGAKATDTDGIDISNAIVKPDVINTSVLASNIKYKYTILSNGITKTVSRKVNVIDTTKPVIIGASDITITTSDSTFDIMNGVSATDNSGETITIKTKSNLALGVNGEYFVTYMATDSSGNLATIIRKIVVQKSNIYDVYANGTAVYFNPVTGSTCTSGEAVSTTGTKTGCMKWYAFNDGGVSTDTINLILDHNTTSTVVWNSTNSNVSGPTNVLTQLQNDTSSWAGVPTRTDSYSVSNGTATYTINYGTYKARLIKASEIATITGNSGFVESVTPYTSWFYLDSNNQTQIATTIGASNYDWLFDYTNGCTIYGCNIADASTWGYWTSTAVSSDTGSAWRVGRAASLGNDGVSDEDFNGVRPVITILKSNL